MIPTLRGNYINPRYITKMVREDDPWRPDERDAWHVTLTDRTSTFISDAAAREFLGKRYVERQQETDNGYGQTNDDGSRGQCGDGAGATG
jgi:hypothetical protein